VPRPKSSPLFYVSSPCQSLSCSCSGRGFLPTVPGSPHHRCIGRRRWDLAPATQNRNAQSLVRATSSSRQWPSQCTSMKPPCADCLQASPVRAKVMVHQAALVSLGARRQVPPYLTSRPSARPASSGEFKIQFKLQQLSKILRNSKFCPKFMKLVLLGSFLIDLSSKNVKHTYMSHEIIR
jgi:hypothetical protein